MHKRFDGITMITIKPIKTEADYRTALKEVESLMTAGPDTPEGERLDVLVTLIEAYEREHYPLELPDPIEAIKFVMEQRALTVKDLEPMIGRSNRVYEILNRKRPLTLKMIWKLHTDLGIPAESLIRQNCRMG
jgi:HTH-type transcriptional regulator/antitoxin HigA